MDITQLLKEARKRLDGDCFQRTAALLQDQRTYLVDGAPTLEEVRALLPTLKARLANADRSGTRIFGITPLIATLEAMPGSSTVIGYGFISPVAAGIIYLAGAKGPALGATIVDR